MMSLKMQQNSERIDEYLNTYMMMNIIQRPKREQWTLACLRKYYSHHYNKYHQKMLFEEVRSPNIRCIEEVNAKLDKLGVFFDQRKFRNSASMKVSKGNID